MKPTVEEPGSKISKLRYDTLLTSFAFNFNLRRYDSVLASPLRVIILSTVLTSVIAIAVAWQFRQGQDPSVHRYCRVIYHRIT